jgi:hypothetical protein
VIFFLDREQDDDREEEPVQGDRADLREEAAVIPLAALALEADAGGEEAGGERSE